MRGRSMYLRARWRACEVHCLRQPLLESAQAKLDESCREAVTATLALRKPPETPGTVTSERINTARRHP